MEPLADAVGLGMVGLGPGVVDVLHRQVEQICVVLGLASTHVQDGLGAPVGEDPIQPDAQGIDEGNRPIIEQVGRGDGALVSVELGDVHRAVGVDEGLLLDVAHPIDGAHARLALRSSIPLWMATKGSVSPLLTPTSGLTPVKGSDRNCIRY